MKRRYAALRVLSFLLFVIGGVVCGVFVLVAVLAFDPTYGLVAGDAQRKIVAAVLTGAGLIFLVGFSAAAELIKLLIDIEANTRRAADRGPSKSTP